ncbi:MAG: hypothetical protein SGPRY_014585 [Prymnesium sp.]
MLTFLTLHLIVCLVQDVKEDSFFTDSKFDWETLSKRQYETPYKQRLCSNEDLCHFEGARRDPNFIDEALYTYPAGDWDYEF